MHMEVCMGGGVETGKGGTPGGMCTPPDLLPLGDLSGLPREEERTIAGYTG